MPDEEALANPNEQQLETGSEAAETEVDEEKAKLEKLKEQLEVVVEDVGVLRKKVTITVPREAIDERLDEQYKELSREAVVPGFRKGRAPRRLLEKRFGGEVSETITSSMLGSGYMAAIEKANLKVLGDPLIWCTPKAGKGASDEAGAGERLMSVREAFDAIELPKEGPLTFACEVEVQPEFELPRLDGIPLIKPKVAVSEKDVDEQVKRFLAVRGEFEPVADGPIEADDYVIAGMKMTADGKVIREAERAALAARPQVIEGIALEKLGEVLVGARIGDVRTIGGVVPEDDERADIRGKPVEFEITIKEIRRLKLPELTDDMVTALGYENVDEFRANLRWRLELQVAEMVRRAMRGQVYRYLLDNTNLDLPARLSQRQTERVIVRRMIEMYREGLPETEVTKRLDEMRTSAREEAVRDVKLFLIMEKIAEELKPEVTEDEVNGVIAEIAARQNRRFDRVRDELMKSDGIQSLFLQIRDDKIVDHLIEQASIRETGPADGEDADGIEPAPRGKPASGEEETFADET